MTFDDFMQGIRNFFRSRYVVHLETENLWLKQQFEFQKGKIERLELALYPLATQAGARYGTLTVPKEKDGKKQAFTKLNDNRPKTFAEIRRDWNRRQAEELAAEEAAELPVAKEN
jgi:hypothetical protein